MDFQRIYFKESFKEDISRTFRGFSTNILSRNFRRKIVDFQSKYVLDQNRGFSKNILSRTFRRKIVDFQRNFSQTKIVENNFKDNRGFSKKIFSKQDRAFLEKKYSNQNRGKNFQGSIDQ